MAEGKGGVCARAGRGEGGGGHLRAHTHTHRRLMARAAHGDREPPLAPTIASATSFATTFAVPSHRLGFASHEIRPIPAHSAFANPPATLHIDQAGYDYGPGHAKAEASFHIAKAEASASKDLGCITIKAEASAALGEVNASAQVNLLGVKAEADASVATASAGIAGTPLQAEASFCKANAQTGLGLDDDGNFYAGAEAGASLCEASAGPFAVRAGVKVGVCIDNGWPIVHLGQCRLMLPSRPTLGAASSCVARLPLSCPL